MKNAISNPIIEMAASPRSLMILRSWPAVSWLIRYDAAIISTENTTMLYGTRSRTDSRKTAPAPSQICLISQPGGARLGAPHLCHEEVFERMADRVERLDGGALGAQSRHHAIRLRVGRQFQRHPSMRERRHRAEASRQRRQHRGRHIRHDQLPSLQLEGEQLVEAARRGELALRDNRHAIAQRFGVGQDVRAEEHGAATLAQSENQIAHVAAAERIEA